MATMAQWVEGARPRTLPAAVAPVLMGSGAAAALDAFRPVQALLALGVALALQIGVNYANDYSDGIRGTDDDRTGPVRLTGGRLASPAAVRAAALASLAVAGVIGLALVARSGHWWLLGIGVACVLAAWYYTGGRRPYGYAGLGEVFVFVFFGLVAVLGTTYTQADRIDAVAVAGAVGIGVLACAILVVNNLRDVPTDTVAGKNTLAVRLGEARTRQFYAALVAIAFLAIGLMGLRHPWVLATWALAPLALVPVRRVLGGARGRDLIPVLGATGRLELLYGALAAALLALST